MGKNIFFIGVDGGGSKTKVLIEDDEGNFIGNGIGGPSNIRLSVDNAWQSIYDAIDMALKDRGLSIYDKGSDFYIGLGLAGVTILEAKKEFLSRKIPFKDVVLESDAHIACLGANGGKDGMIVSVGTGVIGYMILNGTTARVGGWGFPHADTGGGAWIGLEAIRLTFDYADGAINGSWLLEEIYSRFDRDIEKMCRWACTANASDFAKIVPIIVEGIDIGDEYSLKLMKKASEAIDTLIYGLRKKSIKEDSITIKLMGGLSRFLFPFLKDNNIELISDSSDVAVRGAIYMIRENFKKMVRP